jgi:hypothetical protein
MNFKNKVAVVSGLVSKAMKRMSLAKSWDAAVSRAVVVEALEGRQMLSAPDLVITNLTGQVGTWVPGQTLTGLLTVRNQGTLVAGDSEALLVLSSDKVMGNADDIELGYVTVGALAVGKVSIIPVTGQLGENVPDGKYYVIARADALAGVVETKEENNTFLVTTPVTVARSVISVTGPVGNISETGGKGSFTITRGGAPLTVPLSVHIAVTGSATRGTDYLLKFGNEVITSDTVTLPAKAGSVKVDVYAIGDTLVEGAESVGLTVLPSMATPLSYTLNASKASALVTIADDEPTVKLTSTSTKFAEDGSLTVTVARSGGSNKAALQVYFDTVGSAIRGTDYKLVSMDGKTTLTDSITLGANAASVTFKAVGIDDQLIEGEEGFALFLEGAPGTDTYSIDKSLNALHIKIADNEPTVKLTTTATKMNEDGSATFTLARTGGSNKLPLTVYFDTFGAAVQGTDYKLVSMDGKTVFGDSVTLAANVGTMTFKAVGIDDQVIEGNENFTIHLADAPGDKTYVIDTLKHEGTVTIIDNEPSVSLTTTTKITSETKGSATFTVARTGGSTASALDVYFTSFLTALQGTDYTLVSADGKTTLANKVTIPAKAASVTFKAMVIDDTKIEGNENIGLYLEDAPGDKTYSINLLKSSVDVTLYDNEPEVSIKVLPDKTSETKGSVTYTVTRAFGSTTSPLTVSFNTMGAAEQGKDYVLTSVDGKSTLTNSVTIPTGATSVSFKAVITDDALIEGSEMIVVQLSPGGGAPTYTVNSSKGFANVTIADNEPTVGVVMVKNAVEGGAKGQFKITRTGGNTASALTVNFTVTNTGAGVATFGTDYTLAGSPATAKLTTSGTEPVSGSITFAAGVTSVTVDVTGLSDVLTKEVSESVVLSLTNTGAYALEAGKNAATVSIAEPPPGPGSPMSVGRYGNSVTLTSSSVVSSVTIGVPKPDTSLVVYGGAMISDGHVGTYTYNAYSKFTPLADNQFQFVIFTLDAVTGFAGETGGLYLNYKAGTRPPNLIGKTIQFYASGTAGGDGTFEAFPTSVSPTKITGVFKIV